MPDPSDPGPLVEEGQQLLLLDEAFNGLDATSVATVRQLFLDLRAEGRTIVMTSHNQDDIDSVCDRVWRLDNRSFTRLPSPEESNQEDVS